MKLTISQIRKGSVHQPYSFEENNVDVSELESLNNDIRRIDPVHVYGRVDVQGDQFFVTFTIEGEMILPCARTLLDVPYPFQIRTNEVFSDSPYFGRAEEEEEIHPIDGEVLDLMPYIKENILLEIPFRVFSDQVDSEEAAPSSGEGWELISEKKEENSIDPRMKKLESLLKNNQKEK